MIKGYQSPNLSTSVSSQFLITTSTDFCPKDLFPRQAMDEWVLPKHQEAQEDPGAGLCNPRVSLVGFWGAQLVSWVSIHPTGNIYIYTVSTFKYVEGGPNREAPEVVWNTSSYI